MDGAYAATAIHPSLPGGREPGTLTTSPSVVRFAYDGGEFSISLSRVAMRRGGSADRLIFFESPDWPEGSIYTSDRAILRDPHLAAHPITSAAIASIAREKNRGLAIVMGVIAAIVLAFFGLAYLREPLAAAVARRVPPSVERKIGDLAMQQIRLGASEISDEDVLAPLRGIVARLDAASTGSKPYEFDVHVIDDPVVNAFALPGGRLALHRGLLLEAESGEEIAGVLAHEMAHVTEQHSLRQMISTIGLYALVQAFFGDTSGLIAVAAEGGSQLAALGFSRDAEREADRVGLELLREARMNPGGMLTFFQKLQSIEKSRGVAGQAADRMAFLSTHPATAERIDRLREMTADGAQGETRPVDLDIEALHAALQRRSNEVKK